MYCPGCGELNSDDAKFCRACRADLKVIAQAMTRHLPVVLASKLDEFIERKNERHRRDSILAMLLGTISLLITVWEYFTLPGGGWFSSLLMACFGFGYGIWEMLAYKRSLALSSRSVKPISASDTIYCPRCAALNSIGFKFCRECGEDLEVVAQALARGLPTVLTNKLDRYIESRNQSIRKDAISSPVVGAIILLLGVIQLVEGHVFRGGLYLLFGCIFLVIGAWDMLVYKRSLRSASVSADLPPVLDTGERLSIPSQSEPPSSVTESTTKHLDRGSKRSKESL